MYRSFLPRVRRTPDIWESWPILREWATLGKHGVLRDTTQIFTHSDLDRDGFITLKEMEGVRLQRARAADCIAFHDTDKDGRVSLSEFDRGYSRWIHNEEVVLKETSGVDVLQSA